VGNWQSTPSHDSNSKYLTATLDTDDYSPTSTYVVFRPDVPQSGNYTIKMYTPGCQGDGTCGTRAKVNVTGFMETGAGPLSPIIAQTNDFDKYDEIYNGHVDVTSGFRPEVTLSPVAGQNPGNNVLTVVAQRVRFEIRTAQDNGTELNGLFEYDPNQQITSTNFTASTIDKAAASLNPQSSAIVNALATSNNQLYVGGNFTNGDGLNYIFAVADSGPTALSGKGLNDQVVTIYPSGSTLYVGGNFTNTQDNSNGDLGRVAVYSEDKWQSLGAGVDGLVTSIVPISNVTGNVDEDVLAITGDFENVRAFDNNPSFAADGFAIWVPSQKNWLQNLDLTSIAISGGITTFVNMNGTERFYAGQITSQGLGASGAAVLNSNNTLSSLGINVNLQQQPQQTSLRKRAITSGQNVNNTGISTALFHKNGDNIDKTILAGHFAAKDKDGQNITNVVIIDSDNAITGFGDEVDANSTFGALGLLGDVLFAGGLVTGQVGDNKVGGVVAYDLANNKFQDSQPPALQGTNVTVHVIAARRNSQHVYVGGRFDSAGALSCPGLCVWDNERSQWNTPGADISGVVTNLLWVSDTKALVAGNLTVGNMTKVLTYDSANSEFQEVAGAGDLPGTVDALCLANLDGSQMWAAGKTSDGNTYLQRFDGSKWNAMDEKLLGPGTNIQGLQALPLTQDHQKSDLLDQNQALLILGQVNITGFGVASAALFNGTTLTPFLLSSAQGGASGSLSKVVAEHENFFQGGGKTTTHSFIDAVTNIMYRQTSGSWFHRAHRPCYCTRTHLPTGGGWYPHRVVPQEGSGLFTSTHVLHGPRWQSRSDTAPRAFRDASRTPGTDIMSGPT
jgi:hypothetical protein